MSSNDPIIKNLRAGYPYPADMSDEDVWNSARTHFQKLGPELRHQTLKIMDDNLPMGMTMSRDVAAAFNRKRVLTIDHEQLLKAGR
jgi:hypothetical protein